MKFQCDICEKIFKTNQHLTQHKNKKNPCKKTQDKYEIQNNPNVLEILNDQHFLIQQNNILQNNVKRLKEEIKILNIKKELTKNFIKYITATNDFDEEIYENLSSWITKAKYKQIKYSDILSTNSILSDCKKKSPPNSIMSDITMPTTLDDNDNTNYSKL